MSQEMSKLEFRLRSVKCVNQQEPFSDEIFMGGTAVDATGKCHKIPVFKVKKDFDKGETKVYNPAQPLFTFDLRNGGVFPKAYLVTTLLIEQDEGKLTPLLDKAFGIVKARVEEAMTAAKIATLGPAGKITKSLEGVLNGVLGKIKGLLSDDVFPEQNRLLSIPSLSHRFVGGKTDSPDETIVFKGHGGKYQVSFDWCLKA